MKTLYLIRHGQAESKGAGPDFDRNLDDTGREEVKSVAEKMLAENIKPDLIISSPANRTLQTATIVAKTVKYKPKDIGLEPDAYYTDTMTMIEILRRQENKYSSILFAGHNPSISHLAGILTNDYYDMIPTGGLVAFEMDADSWNHFDKNKIRFLFKIYP